LVYILENNHIVSKNECLKFINIIEWGPNVYGIGEASRFYFQKSPSELTFNDVCFWLNHPNPRKFMYQFNDQGKLRFCSYAGIVLTNIMSKEDY
jgi:membrane peptidoglycan carboxypeptidase